jgi:YVTN family beta-propeller protein
MGDGTVSRMNPATLKVIATIPVGESPWAIAAGADGVWVANQGDDTVSRIDPSTNLVVATITVGGKLTALAVGQRGVWVSSDKALSMIDAGTNAVTSTLALDKIGGLAADGGTIWGAESLGANVQEIDEATASVRSVIALSTNSWSIAIVGSSVWVSQPAAADKKFADRSPGTITRLDH